MQTFLKVRARIGEVPWPLFLILLLQLSLWSLHPMSLGTSDVASYAKRALALSDGSFFDAPDNHVFNHRLGLLLPVAVLYKLIGVSDWTTFFLPLMAGLGLTLSVWLVLRKNFYAASLGASIVAFSPLCVEHLGSLFPDLIVTSLSAGALALLGERERVQRTHLLAAAVSLLVVWGFSVKLTAYYLLPALALAFALDLRRNGIKGLVRFQLPLISYGLLGTGLLLFVSELLWDDPFARIEAVNSHKHTWQVDQGDTQALYKRLVVEPWSVLQQSFSFPLSLALCGLVASGRQYYLWAVFLLTATVSILFGSAASDQYQPLPLFPRMFLPMLPALGVFSGSLIPSAPALDRHKARLGLLCCGLGLSLLVSSALWLKSANEIPDHPRLAMEKIQESMAATSSQRTLVVVGEGRSAESLGYYLGWTDLRAAFKYVAKLKNSDLKGYDKFFVYTDVTRARHLAKVYQRPDYSGLMRPQGAALYSTRDVYLYEVDRTWVEKKIQAVARLEKSKRIKSE